jgi:hypothetical protein
VVPLSVSRETTFITTPLLSDGTPDYIATLNARFGNGVTRDNNAAPVLRTLELVGTTVDSTPLANALKGRFEPWPVDFDKAYREQMARSRVAPWRAADAPLAAAWLRVNEAQLRRIDEVVAAAARWWDPLTAGLGFDSAVPSLMPARNIANAYRTRTMGAIGTYDDEGALGTTRSSLRYAAMFDRGSFLERLMGIMAHDDAVEPAVVLANPPRRLATAEQLLAALKAVPATPPLDDVVKVEERLSILGSWADLYRAARQSPAAFRQRLGEVAGVQDNIATALGGPPLPPNLRRIPGVAVDWNELFRIVNACWDNDGCASDLRAAEEELRPGRFERLRARALLFHDARQRMARALLTLQPPTASVVQARVSWGEQQAEARLALVSAAAAVARLSLGRYPADASTLGDLAGVDPQTDHAGYAFHFAANGAGQTFTYTATPMDSAKTGRRFCADSAGRLASGTGRAVLVRDGLCSQALQTLAARTP